eukprot:m.273920 g.273920  ORF g.273920 m.273920 type:complete len:93 (-) comp11090_c1_seq46:2426-2704(-)
MSLVFNRRRGRQCYERQVGLTFAFASNTLLPPQRAADRHCLRCWFAALKSHMLSPLARSGVAVICVYETDGDVGDDHEVAEAEKILADMECG